MTAFSLKGIITLEEDVQDIDFKMKKEDIYCKVKIIPTTFEDGRHGVTLILSNITDHKIAENALRESQENFRYLLEKINKNKK